MSQSFIKIKRPDNGSHSALAGLGVLSSDQPRAPCTVCGMPYERHGTYPTCASHPYTADGKCQHVGALVGSVFTGAPCAGVECRSGCVRGRGAVPAPEGGKESNG